MSGPPRSLEAVPPQYAGEQASLEGYLYTRAEKKSWVKRFCRLYRERIEAYKKKPGSGHAKPSETYEFSPNHYVQAVSTKTALKKRKHAFMLSDFTTNVYFSGMADPADKSGGNLQEVEYKLTAQWLQVLGKNIAALQSKKKWWIKTDTEIDVSEEELDEDFKRNLVKYKRARGANVDKDKETEKETEAAIARVFVNMAAERASVRMFSKQEKEEEFRRLKVQMEEMKLAQKSTTTPEQEEEKAGELDTHFQGEEETRQVEKLKLNKEAEDNLSKVSVANTALCFGEILLLL